MLETLIENAVKLCGAQEGGIFKFDGELCHLGAMYGGPPNLKDFLTQNPFRPSRSTIAGRAALERQTIHVANILTDPEYEGFAIRRVAGYRLPNNTGGPHAEGGGPCRSDFD